MTLKTEFVELALADLHREAAICKAEGWRFIQTHAVNTDDGVDLYYSFMKDGLARNYHVAGVKKDQPVPSITDMFLAAFVFENEARELFGVDMRDIAIDFQGAMYAPAQSEPMTFMSPEQKAARDKARKAAAAKAAKAAGAAASADAPAKKRSGFKMTPEKREKLEAKLATMSPEKVTKVRAALARIEKENAEAASGAPAEAAAAAAGKPAEAAGKPAEKPSEPAQAAQVAEPFAVDRELEAKIALLDADKAAKVRAALGGTPVQEEAAPVAVASDMPKLDADIEAKLSMMDPAKADKVRAALAAKASREAAEKGGE